MKNFSLKNSYPKFYLLYGTMPILTAIGYISNISKSLFATRFPKGFGNVSAKKSVNS